VIYSRARRRLPERAPTAGSVPAGDPAEPHPSGKYAARTRRGRHRNARDAAFYYAPKKIDDLIEQFAFRALAQLGLRQEKQYRWKGGKE